jgi:hypothetical protein
MATDMPKKSLATVSEPFSIASCVPIDGDVRGLAATPEVVLAKSGRESAPTAMRLAMRNVRM